MYVSNSADDYEPNLQAAVDDGNDLVIAVGFLLAPSTIKVATANPDVSFAGVDHFYGEPGDAACEESKTCAVDNALGMQYPSEEAGYLAGIVAALTTKTNTVSTVGGIKIPPVDNWIAGYQAGVKATKPNVKTLNAYSNDFNDAAKCKEIALDQISTGLRRRVPGRGRLRPRRARRGVREERDRDRRRRRPVGAGRLRAHERAQAAHGVGVRSHRRVRQGPVHRAATNQFFGIQDLPDAKLLAPFTPAASQEIQDAVAEAEAGLKDGTIDPPADAQVGSDHTGGGQSSAPVRWRPHGRRSASPRAEGHHEALPGRGRERPGRLRPAPRRGARPARRERRREVDADERPLRPLPARTRARS